MNPKQISGARVFGPLTASLRPVFSLRFLVLGAWLLGSAAGRPAVAANVLEVGTGSGASGTTVSIPLNLDNDDVVKGVQADIQFDPAVVSYLSVEAGARIGTMEVGANLIASNKLRLLVTQDIQHLDATIAAGTGTIATITFQLVGAGGTSSALALSGAILADINGQPLAVTSQNGSLTVTGGSGGQNILAVGTATGASGTTVTIPLSLDNDDVVKGAQADIQFDPAVVEYVSVEAGARIGTMEVGANLIASNKLRLLVTQDIQHLDATIAAGTGAIATISFRLVGAGGTSSALALSGAILADINGQPLAVTSQNGSLTVTGGSGGQNILAVGTATGASGSTVTIPVNLDNDDVVKGVQADIQFDPAVVEYVSVEAGARIGTMEVGAALIGETRIRVLLTPDPDDLAATIAAGTGAIAHLTLRLVGAGGTGSALTPQDVLLSDAEGHALDFTTEAGSVTVTGGSGGQNILAVGTATGASGATVTIPLNLDNDDVVKGAQADIQFDPAVVEYVSVEAGVRIGTMEVGANLIATNKLRLLVTQDIQHLDATIAAGTGAIANVSFQLVGAGGTNSSLTLSGVVLSDASGSALSVTTQNGSISVTGGGPLENILSMGTASGDAGTQITVAMALENENSVKALQTDLQFDPAVLSYVSGVVTGRGAAMTYGANLVENNIVRVVIHYGATPEVLAPGTGAIANLVFQAVGAGGTQSTLTPTETELSDPAGQTLPVTNQAGSISVTGGGGAAPVLRLTVLKNPARTRTLQVFITSDQDLTALPTLTVGGSAVTVAAVAAQSRIWQGAASLSLGAISTQVTATGTNGTQTGTAQVTVNF